MSQGIGDPPEKIRAGEPLLNYPQLVDITASTGIHFEHLSSPEAKFIAESMSGGVALIDYDRDGWRNFPLSSPVRASSLPMKGSDQRSVHSSELGNETLKRNPYHFLGGAGAPLLLGTPAKQPGRHRRRSTSGRVW